MAITKNNTAITHIDGFTTCILHSTQIVKWDGLTLILDSGGWQTVTTKRRMNECLREWGIPARVYQENYTWFVNFWDSENDRQRGQTAITEKFHDGMKLEF